MRTCDADDDDTDGGVDAYGNNDPRLEHFKVVVAVAPPLTRGQPSCSWPLGTVDAILVKSCLEKLRNKENNGSLRCKYSTTLNSASQMCGIRPSHAT